VSTIFDSEEADRRHSEFDIQPIFRGMSKDDSKKVLFCFKLHKEIFKSLLKGIVSG
tara:strand:+ start:1049 stop:1216 length:168 start_codon:yes stop_codon:yes gene_type:complete